MATFGLIHGAWHGAWCWERLLPELARLGHAARTPELPVDDPDADMDGWTACVIRSLVEAPGPVILVGHSLAGVLLPLVAARRPVAHQVYLAAILHPALVLPGGPEPHPKGTFRDLERFPDGSHRWPSAATATPRLYNDCAPDDASWAFCHLRRQQTARPWAAVPVPDPWPRTPVSAIVCRDDRTVQPAFGRWAAREILGTEPIELDADHSPFLSRPRALAEALAAIAAQHEPHPG